MKNGTLNSRFNKNPTQAESIMEYMTSPRSTFFIFNIIINDINVGMALSKSKGPKGLMRFPINTPNVIPITAGIPIIGTNPIKAFATLTCICSKLIGASDQTNAV